MDSDTSGIIENDSNKEENILKGLFLEKSKTLKQSGVTTESSCSSISIPN
jgi:hypothetical protein